VPAQLADTQQDDASTISTVMAVAMAGRAIKPSLDVLQQLVKSQRENVAAVIDEEQRQIDQLKSSLDEIVRENENLESDCLSMEAKVRHTARCRRCEPSRPAASACPSRVASASAAALCDGCERVADVITMALLLTCL
jgi:predicted transcriptional regulator